MQVKLMKLLYMDQIQYLHELLGNLFPKVAKFFIIYLDLNS